jgi:malonyl-CoA/methylmalonyl-CoA synthetase
VQAAGATLDAAAMQLALEQRLAKFKCPKRILVVDDLPRNTMGKVQKNVLRDRHKGLYE